MHNADSWGSGRRIVVVGDLMLDVFTEGVAHRISPEAPVPVVNEARRWSTPGGAGNAASNLAALGEHVVVVGLVGQDSGGDELIASLRSMMVDTSQVIRGLEKTSIKHRILASGQQLVRVDIESSIGIPESVLSECLSSCRDSVSGADAVLVSDYGKGVCSDLVTRGVIKAARSVGIPVVVDPKGNHFDKYRGCSVVTPNLHEAAMASGSSDDVDAMGPMLREATQASVLITRGAEGMSLYAQGGSNSHFPTVARAVFDVTGAGDTVAAVLTAGLARGLDLAAAANLANECAGLIVAKRGTRPIHKSELQELLDTDLARRAEEQ